MHRRRPLSLTWTAFAPARAAWLLALVLLLAACGAPGTPPGLQLSIGTASVAVLRGATADVQVVLTRLGGAADDVDLSVTGLPANVTASFAPPALTGATLASTLTLTVGAGASEGTTALTVTATSGALSDDAALSLEVTGLTVNGRLVANGQQPLVGATVTSQGETDFADANGEFTLTGLSIPYDLTVSAAIGDGGMHIYEGMTSATPLLRPAFTLSAPVAQAFGTTVTGNLLDGALGADEVVVVCVEGLAVVVFGCDGATSGESSFAIDAAWFVGSLAAAELHAFHFTVDADGVPVTYLGYENIAVNLQDGVGTLADLDFDSVTTGTLTGTGVKPVEHTDGEVFVLARFGPNLSMPLAGFDLLGGDFELLVPTLAGLSYDVLFATGVSVEAAYAWNVGTGLDAGTLATARPPESIAPADGAVDVDLNTPFETTAAGGGARTYVWAPVAAGPVIGLTTTRTQVTIPDPAGAGLPYPAGDDYRWAPFGHGGADVDAAAAGGYLDFFDLQTSISGGGPGFDSDRAFALNTDPRDFAFAP